MKLSTPVVKDGDVEVHASVTVTNTGSVAGSEVVQLYVTLPTTSPLTHPPLMLKAFSKVRDLGAGQSTVVTLQLDKLAISYWEERIARWVVESGSYLVRVGTSSAPESLVLSDNFVISSGFEWNGL